MKNKVLMIIGAMLIVLIVVSGIILTKNAKDKRILSIEVADGLKVVRTYETVTDVALVESEIKAFEDAQTEEESRLRDETDEEGEVLIANRFTLANAMVAGDSQAQALSAYQILNESNVAAKIGQHVADSSDQLTKIVNMNASIVFMTYGMNDLGMYGSAEDFANAYGEKLQWLRDQLPDVQIYVNAIFPANASAIAKQSWLGPANLNAFNAALQKKTESMGMTFINSNGLVQESYYEPDGEHFTKVFYELWAKNMADAAGF